MENRPEDESGSGAAEAAVENRFEKHKRWWITGILLGSVVLPLAALELGLRAVGAYDPFELSFYTVQSGDDERVRITPYGTIRINELGFADVEFDLSDPRERVGYIGDSVVYGLGVGHGYRVTDHLREILEEYQHFTIGESGSGVPSPGQAESLVTQLGLDKLIYVMNLNDVRPTPTGAAEADGEPPPSLLRSIRMHPAFEFVDRLRMSSRTYNMLRLAARNALIRRGYDGYRGETAYELHPQAHREVVAQTAARVDDLAAAMAARDVDFCVVVLPYEMQISAAAERYYGEIGIQWEEGFVDGSTQAMLTEKLAPGIEVVDASHAFLRPGRRAEDRASIEVGQFFVTRAGGALDWNHPNRAGHERLAEYLMTERPCSL